jgi:integrase
MRFSSPSHLRKQGVAFYFRIAVPERLRPVLGKVEVKKSLSTVYLREAKLRVVQVSAVVQGFLGYLDAAGPLAGMTPPEHLQAYLEGELAKVSAYWKGPEEVQKVSQVGYLALGLPKVQPGLRAKVQTPSAKSRAVTIPAPQPMDEVGSKLCEAVDKYIEDKADKWRTSSKKDIVPDLRDFAAMVGDIQAADLNRDHMRTYHRIMHHLPKRRTVDPKYKKKPLAKLLNMKIPETDKLSSTTLDNTFTNVRSFINWLEDEGLVQRAATLNKMLEVRRKNVSPEREPFTDDELRSLFSPQNFRPEVFRSSWQFWLPLMGLHTGARLEELCQLHLTDIRQDEASGIWYMSINDEGDKKTKTSAGNRRVPLHPALLELGLLDRVDALGKRYNRLFPTLELRASAGKLGGAAGQWFTRYRRQCGVGAAGGEASSKVFHSFRHTVVTRCLHLGLVRRMYQEVVGHEKGAYSDVTGGYEGRYPVKVLYDEVVSKLDFSGVVDIARLKGGRWVRQA